MEPSKWEVVFVWQTRLFLATAFLEGRAALRWALGR